MKIALIEQYKGLPGDVYTILVARVITAMGAFVFPFLTFFLSTRLHMTETLVSRYLLVFSIAYIPASLLGGKLADRFSKKHVYVSVLFISDIFYIICGFIYEQPFSVYLLLAAHFFMCMGMPILSAMMMDLTGPENRQAGFSLIYLGYNLGFAVGPTIAGLLFENHTPWIFWGQALLSLIAILLIATKVHTISPYTENTEAAADSTPSIVKEKNLTEKGNGGSLLYQLLKHPIMLWFAVIGITIAFSCAQMSFVMPLHMADIFGVANGSKFFGILWSINGVVVTVATPLTLYIFKRFNPLQNIAIAAVFYGVGYGLYAYVDKLFFMYLLVILWSTGEALLATNNGVFIAIHAPVTHRARFQSIYDTMMGLGRAIGPVIMGYFLLAHSFEQCWKLVGGVALTGAALYYILYLSTKNRQD